MKTQEKELRDLVAEIKAAGRGERLKLLPELLLRVSQLDPRQQLRVLTRVLGGPQASRFLELYQASRPARTTPERDSGSDEPNWLEKLEGLLIGALESPKRPEKPETEMVSESPGLKADRKHSASRPSGKIREKPATAVDPRESVRPETAPRTTPPPPLPAPSSPPVKVESSSAEPDAQVDRQGLRPPTRSGKPPPSERESEVSLDDLTFPPPAVEPKPPSTASELPSRGPSDRARTARKTDSEILVEKLLKIDSPFRRYRFYCQQVDDLDLDRQTALDLIDGLPSPWMKRRALSHLLETKFFPDAEAAVAALNRLSPSSSQFIWLTRSLVSNYALSDEQKAALITSSPSDTIGRLLKRFLDD